LKDDRRDEIRFCSIKTIGRGREREKQLPVRYKGGRGGKEKKGEGEKHHGSQEERAEEKGRAELSSGVALQLRGKGKS